MSFRLLIQPAVAILFAIRAGLREARQNKTPFLQAVLFKPGCRQEGLRQVWRDVGTVFIVALIIDSICQIIVHAGIYTLELLITATVLAVLPYMVSREVVTRIAKWAGVGKQADLPTAHEEEPEK